MARPRWLAARKSSRSFPTIAGRGGDGVQRPLQAGPDAPLLGAAGGGGCGWSRRLRGPGAAGGPVRRRRAAGRGRARRGRRPTPRPGRRVRAWRSTPRSSRPARRPRCGAVRARGAVPATGSPACSGLILARREVRNSRTSASVVHALDTTATFPRLGCPVSTPINSDFLACLWRGSLVDMTRISTRSHPRYAAGVAAAAGSLPLLVAVLAGCTVGDPASRRRDPAVVDRRHGVRRLRDGLACGSCCRFDDEVVAVNLGRHGGGAASSRRMLPLSWTCAIRWGRPSPGRLPRPLDVAGAATVTDPGRGRASTTGRDSATIAIFYDDLGQSVPPPRPGPARCAWTRRDAGNRIASAGNQFTVSDRPWPDPTVHLDDSGRR